jgi:hypothetical protein
LSSQTNPFAGGRYKFQPQSHPHSNCIDDDLEAGSQKRSSSFLRPTDYKLSVSQFQIGKAGMLMRFLQIEYQEIPEHATRNPQHATRSTGIFPLSEIISVE